MGIRITGGILGGRVISSPRDRFVRPTASMTRQALFNILGDRVARAQMLDLFAGSGIVSFEALSRGARHVSMVELNRRTVAQIRENAAELGLSERVSILCVDAMKAAFEQNFDLIYADPPFTQDYPDLRRFLSLLNRGGVAVFEMPSRHLPVWIDEASDLRRYGESTLAFFLT